MFQRNAPLTQAGRLILTQRVTVGVPVAHLAGEWDFPCTSGYSATGRKACRTQTLLLSPEDLPGRQPGETSEVIQHVLITLPDPRIWQPRRCCRRHDLTDLVGAGGPII